MAISIFIKNVLENLIRMNNGQWRILVYCEALMSISTDIEVYYLSLVQLVVDRWQ